MNQNQYPIVHHLLRLCKEHNVMPLFACESGSRAWGIESEDSDYDVRFIYMQNVDVYLSLFPRLDTITWMSDDRMLDFAGWDLKKALQLGYKSNPGLMEWLHSPIMYHECAFVPQLRRLMQNFSPKALMYHYASLAGNTSKTYLRSDDPFESVSLKKYLYAMRPLLAVQYMNEFNHVMPPVSMGELLSAGYLTGRDANDMQLLLELKQNGAEGTTGRFPSLDAYIGAALDKDTGWAWDMAEDAPGRSPVKEEFDQLFRRTVRGEV